MLNVAVQVNYSIPSHLPQINLLLLFGEKSYLPFYYRKLAGNIPDVKTLQVLIRDLDILGYSKVKLVTDRGFYSTGNVNSLHKEHMQDKNLFKKYTLQGLLDELDVIECFMTPGKDPAGASSL
ncbi:MAG: hypothetical protein PHG38_07675, partial [Bacteroidales bacterium]|nr:hypothetical protein [Bacteroidales bacterium]